MGAKRTSLTRKAGRFVFLGHANDGRVIAPRWALAIERLSSFRGELMKASSLGFQAGVVLLVVGMIWGIQMGISKDHAALPHMLISISWALCRYSCLDFTIAFTLRWTGAELRSCRSRFGLWARLR